jgi:hypothetical protein
MLTLTPYQNRKDRKIDFDECSQLKTTIEKNGRRKAKIFQNKCVSSQKGRIKKRRGRHRSGVTYLLRGETVRAGLVRAEWAAILHGDIQLYRKPP